MKGRTCTDGREKLKKAVPRDETPLTVSTESLITTGTIDAQEGCNVRISNILGAFISADVEKDVKIALLGRLAELMVNIVPKIYRQNVIYKK